MLALLSDLPIRRLSFVITVVGRVKLSCCSVAWHVLVALCVCGRVVYWMVKVNVSCFQFPFSRKKKVETGRCGVASSIEKKSSYGLI